MVSLVRFGYSVAHFKWYHLLGVSSHWVRYWKSAMVSEEEMDRTARSLGANVDPEKTPRAIREFQATYERDARKTASKTNLSIAIAMASLVVAAIALVVAILK